MGGIKELVKNSQGIVREAVILLPSRRLIRRPLNLLTPLELDEPSLENIQRDQQLETTAPQPTRQHKLPIEGNNTTALTETTPRERTGTYNLRRQQRIDYKKLLNPSLATTLNISLILNILSLLTLLGQCSAANSNRHTNTRHIKCIKGGIQLTSPGNTPCQVCADGYCKTLETPKPYEIVSFPPHIILHKIQWKLADNQSIDIIETTCPPSPFCEHLNCVLCAVLIFNPECWPTGALLASAIVIYCIVTGCYVLLYVPLTLGKPIRVILHFTWHAIRSAITSLNRKIRRPRSTHHNIKLSKIIMIAISFTLTCNGCQQVNLFSHMTTLRRQEQRGQVCDVQLSEVLKINPVTREACFKLLNNETSLYEIRIEWKSLTLTCEPETDLFTRDTEHHVIDSKRCPHTGSCKGEKCAGINATSLIPELAMGNKYPGITACVESCGGAPQHQTQQTNNDRDFIYAHM
ncbi:unnamed protein product [Angiostrongylus costaricensis]|uniref:Phlebovirus_G2 domain-containing protein n=1 Tax=Angiostrongylus costaricensis TaxID=334426 RepID=A0A0R3Q2K7_ANGCS|nr:unnamed protein product [Angiostrongylus costaricensis]